MSVEFTMDDMYFALTENGEAVVLVHDSTVIWHTPHSENIGIWLNDQKKNRTMSILNKAEFGTYHVICDLEQINIIEFTEWMKKHDSNSDTKCKHPNPRNPIRKLWKSIQDFR